MVSWPHCFWVFGKVSHHSGSAWQSTTAHLMARKQESRIERKRKKRKRERRRGWGPSFPFKGTSPRT